MKIDKYIPEVIDKSLMTQQFDPLKIYNSLLKETDLTEKEADTITTMVIRFIISMGDKIHMITSPMIREIVNVMLLKQGFEKARLQYTRIGYPVHDLKKIFKEYNNKEKIVVHVINEYKEVIKMIKKLEKEEKES